MAQKVSDLKKNSKISSEELKALNDYTGGESLWFNNFLRNRDLDKIPNPKEEIPKLEKKVGLLGNIIKKSSPLNKELIVYRGAEAMDESWRNLKPDDELIFTSTGMVSTSYDKDIAEDFIDDKKNPRCCLLTLTLPVGTKCIDVDISSYKDERELLLPHGSIFIVNKRTVEDNTINFYATLIKQKDIKEDLYSNWWKLALSAASVVAITSVVMSIGSKFKKYKKKKNKKKHTRKKYKKN